MTMDGSGIVPVMEVGRGGHGYGYGDGCGCGGGFGGAWFLWIIVLFALMGGNGFGGWNRNGGFDMAATIANGSATRDQMADEFAYNDIKNGIRGIQNGLCDGFYAQNTTMLNGFNGLEKTVMQGNYNVTTALNENRFAAQQCCCETNRNIDAVRSENYKNTCEITNAIRAEGEATRALINANAMQDLRDRLEERDRALMTANFQLSQQAQSAELVSALHPCPIPAYITCSPYQTVNANPCGCACGTY